MKIAESSQNGQKTLWEKEELLVTSNFSFSHSVFKRLVQQTRKKTGLVWERMNAFFVCFIITTFIRLTLRLLSAFQGPFRDIVDQDQTAQNVQSDFRSTLSDKETFFFRSE